MNGLEPRHTPVTQNAATLSLRSPSPYAMVDTISQGIFQARRFDRTIETDALRRLHPDPVARKEHGRVHVPTFGLSCPFGPHGASHPRQFLRWILHLRYQQITPTCETAVDQLWVPCGQPERHGQRRHLGFDRACSGPAPSSASGHRQAETEIPSSLAPAGPRKTTPDDPDSTDETPHVGGPCRGGRGVNRRPIEPERQLGASTTDGTGSRRPRDPTMSVE